MANLIGLKAHPMATVKGPDGKLYQVPCKLTNKQQHFLSTKIEESKNYEKRFKRS
jgi:hypothetical protein